MKSKSLLSFCCIFAYAMVTHSAMASEPSIMTLFGTAPEGYEVVFRLNYLTTRDNNTFCKDGILGDYHPMQKSTELMASKPDGTYSVKVDLAKTRGFCRWQLASISFALRPVGATRIFTGGIFFENPAIYPDKEAIEISSVQAIHCSKYMNHEDLTRCVPSNSLENVVKMNAGDYELEVSLY